MNTFDNLSIKINKLFEYKNYKKKSISKGFVFKFLSRYLIGLLILTKVYEKLINSGFILGWFYEFREYWTDVLKGRPIYFHDFNFLLGVYRQRFQKVHTPNNADIKDFLFSWQNEHTIYQLFGAVRRFSYEPLHCYKYERYIKDGDKILEYGCGIAPITYSLIDYSLKRKLEFNILDIRQINSHYAKWRLGNKAKFIEAVPYENPLINHENSFNIIFLITVLEHLPDPLNVIKNIHSSLKSKGHLLFDFILSDGEGQDTKEAIDHRKRVLEFIEKNFNLIDGNLSVNESIEFCVVQKK